MTLHTGSFYVLEANYGLVHPQGKKSYKEYYEDHHWLWAGAWLPQTYPQLHVWEN